MSDVLPVLTGRVPKGVNAKQIADEAIEAAFKLIHDRFREAGYNTTGDVAPNEAYVLDAVGEAFVGMVAANITNRAVEGDRVRFRHAVDRYPHFQVPEGATGEVTEVEADVFAVTLDDHLDGAETWDNEVHWYPQNGDDPDRDLEVIQ